MKENHSNLDLLIDHLLVKDEPPHKMKKLNVKWGTPKMETTPPPAQ
jgi:hypothetical protein